MFRVAARLEPQLRRWIVASSLAGEQTSLLRVPYRLNYHAQRGSAAMDGPAGSDKVQTGEAADQVMVVGAPAPQTTVQIAADAVPKKPRAEKRAAQDAMSPGHLASTTALSPVERRQQHAVLGVDKDFRDKGKEAESSLGLTKDVRELQQVMRQVVRPFRA